MFTPPEVTLPEWAKRIKLVSGAGSSGDNTCCVMSLARLIQLYRLHPGLSSVEGLLAREREDDFEGGVDCDPSAPPLPTAAATTAPAQAVPDTPAPPTVADGDHGDRFRPEAGALGLMLEVEEWIYFDIDHDAESARLIATPKELHQPNLAAARTLHKFGALREAFRVVLTWQETDGQEVPHRDIGPAFWTTLSRREALKDALAFARAEAKRLKASGPIGYQAARQFQWSEEHVNH